MLSDTERKILRILYNQRGHEWYRPDLKQLCRLSQRTSGQVKTALCSLAEQGYIEAQDDRIRVIISLEPETQMSRSIKPWEV